MDDWKVLAAANKVTITEGQKWGVGAGDGQRAEMRHF